MTQRRYGNPRQPVSCAVQYYDPSAMTLKDALPSGARGWLILKQKGVLWRVRDVFEANPGDWRELFPTGTSENASRATHRAFEAWEPPEDTTFESIYERIRRPRRERVSSDGSGAKKDRKRFKHLLDTKHGRYQFKEDESPDAIGIAPDKVTSLLHDQWRHSVSAPPTDYRAPNERAAFAIGLERA